MRLPITALLSLAAFLLCTLGSIDAAIANSSSLRSAQSESLIAYVCIQDKSQPTQNQRQLWECHGWDFVSGVRVNWYAYTGGLGNPVGFHDPSGYAIEDAIRGMQSALPSGSDIALGLILQVLSKANPATLVLFLGVDIYNRYEQLQQLAAAWDCDSERDFLLGQLVAELVLSKRKTRLDVPPPKLKGKGPGKSDNPTYCFVGHTLVHTSQGLKPIEFIEPG